LAFVINLRWLLDAHTKHARWNQTRLNPRWQKVCWMHIIRLRKWILIVLALIWGWGIENMRLLLIQIHKLGTLYWMKSWIVWSLKLWTLCIVIIGIWIIFTFFFFFLIKIFSGSLWRSVILSVTLRIFPFISSSSYRRDLIKAFSSLIILWMILSMASSLLSISVFLRFCLLNKSLGRNESVSGWWSFKTWPLFLFFFFIDSFFEKSLSYGFITFLCRTLMNICWTIFIWVRTHFTVFFHLIKFL
jgi:hypothetical protein